MYINSNPDDEYVMVFQPVFVRRRDIHSLPPMMNIQQTPPRIPIELLAPDPIEQPEPLPPPARASSVPHMPQNPMKELASYMQMKCILTFAREHGISDVELCQELGAEAIELITKAQASKFIQKYIE